MNSYAKATYSGSLWSTLSEFLSVERTSVSAFLLSVILAGSPNVEERALFEFTWLYNSNCRESCDFLTRKKPIAFGIESLTFLKTIAKY